MSHHAACIRVLRRGMLGARSGPSIAGRHTLLVVDADHLLMEMFENKNGKNVRTMQMEYTRVK